MFQTNSSQTFCEPCNAGMFGNDTGLARPDCNGECPLGHYCPQATGDPITCKSGTICPQRAEIPYALLPGRSYIVAYNEEGDLEMTNFACPAGKFKEAQDSTGDNLACTNCPKGKFNLENSSSYCRKCQYDEYLHSNKSACVPCPYRMATCEDGVRKYHGHVWHALTVKDPTPDTEHYMCINEGCPDKGSNASMYCKLGYHGPLCAICDQGYYRKLNRFCEKCQVVPTSCAQKKH
jgi:hypothetical protein